MKDRKKLSGTDMGIVLSIIGIIASVAVIVMNFIDGESKAVGIALFCSCTATLSINVRNKRNDK